MIRILALIIFFMPSMVFALGVGNITLSSALNQEFSADIRLYGVEPEEIDGIKVRLGDKREFERSKVRKYYWLSSLSFSIDSKPDGNMYIHVSSDNAMIESFVDFIMVVESPKSIVMRQFTVLLDPPANIQKQAKRANNFSEPSNTFSQPSVNNNDPTEVDFSEGESYQVQRGDSLSKIAAQLVPGDGSISIQQMMMALLERNPDAFLEQNINRIIAGRTLHIPNDTGVSDTGLASEVIESSDSRIDVEVDDGQSFAASNAEVSSLRNALKIANREKKAQQSEIRKLRRELQAFEKKVIRAQKNVEMLTESKANLQRRLQEQVAEDDLVARTNIDDMVEPAADEIAEEPVDMVVDEPIAVVDEVMDEATDDIIADESYDIVMDETDDIIADESYDIVADETDDIIVDDPDDIMVDDIIDESDDIIDESDDIIDESDDIIDESDDIIVDETDDILEDTDIEEGVVDTSDVDGSSEEIDYTDGEIEVEQAKTTTDVETSENNDMLVYGAVGGAGLLLLSGVFWFVKRRKSDALEDDSIPEEVDYSATGTASAISDDATEGNETLTGLEELEDEVDLSFSDTSVKEVQKPNFEDTAILSVDETAIFEGDDTAILDDMMPDDEMGGDDVITEADIAIAYGNYDEAEEALEKAIAEHPDNDDYKVKQLEVLHAAGHSEKFAEKASELHVSLGGAGGSHWDKVNVMGQEICADNPLFSSDSATSDVTDTQLADVGDFGDDLGFDVSESDDDDASLLDFDLSEEGEGDSIDLSADDGDNFDLTDLGLDNADLDLDSFGDDDMDSLLEGNTDTGADLDLTELDGSNVDTDLTELDEVSAEVDLTDLDVATDVDLTDLDVATDADLTELDAGADVDLSEFELNDDMTTSAEKSDTLFPGHDLETDVNNSTLSMDKETLASAVEGMDEELFDLGEDLGIDIESEEEIEFDFGDDLGVLEDAQLSESEGVEDIGDHTQVFEFDEADEIGTKLDLARAYIDMGDSDGARDILDEVLKEGNDSQKKEAEELMGNLS